MPAQRERLIMASWPAGQRVAVQVPVIQPKQWAELIAVEPTRGPEECIELRPCAAEMIDGRTLERLYFVEALSYVMGFRPKQDKLVSLNDVAHIIESPHRLPVRLANLLYKKGETSMGGMEFAVILRDGRELGCATGNYVDFLEYPPGVSASDVVDVVQGRTKLRRQCHPAPYLWCLYGLDPNLSETVTYMKMLAEYRRKPFFSNLRMNIDGADF